MQVYGVGINFLDETQQLPTMPSWVRKCLGSALGDEFTELLVTEYHVGDTHPPHIDRTMWGPKIVGLSLLSAVSFVLPRPPALGHANVSSRVCWLCSLLMPG